MEFVHRPELKTFEDADAVNDLKHKIIHEYQNLLCKVSKGYKPDYEFIMQEISLVDLLEDNFLSIDDVLFIIQYYLNNYE